MSNLIIRFHTVSEQEYCAVKRIIGFVRASELTGLLDSASLDANPRSAKRNNITVDIIDSIKFSPDTFVFQTKGILLGTSVYESLERNRYRLEFPDPQMEGILDGGHNALAIGMYILSLAVGQEKFDSMRIKNWSDFKDCWEKNSDIIHEFVQEDKRQENKLDFLVPLEILVPSSEEAINDFSNSLLNICASRNNNAQLTADTKANQKGFFEELKDFLPEQISQEVEWKTNDGGRIKVRDLVALAMIPLSALNHKSLENKFQPQMIYNSKGECVKLFDQLLSGQDVSKKTEGGYKREIHNEAVISALRIAGNLPELFDKIYKDFPEWYNKNGGKFGARKEVSTKENKNNKIKKRAPFTGEEVSFSYPSGWIVPVVFGLRSLLQKDTNGCLSWAVDPKNFLDEYGEILVRRYTNLLDGYGYDPQKVGKSNGCYTSMLDDFNLFLKLKTMQH